VGYFTFALNYLLHGADVAGYHIVNLIIHVLNALLVYGLVVLSFRTPLLQRSSLKHRAGTIALFSALLFAGHPVQTEAVTYIVQRFASLATLFYLVSLAAYIKSRLAGLENRSKWKTPAWYAVSLVSAVLAMKTKEIAFTLPVVITLYEFLFFEGTIKKRILLLLPLLLTMVIIPMSLLGTARPLGEMINDVSEATRVQTDVTRMEYLFTEFTVIVTYLRLLFLPYNQNLDYDYPLFQSFFATEVVLSFLLLVLIFGAGIYLLYRDRRSPGAGRLMAFGILWFFITLSVESSVIPIVDVIFEHRLYLPSVGFFITCTSALFLGAERLKSRWAGAERAVMGVLAAVVIVFTGLTYARNIVWQSEVSLWEDVIKKGPEKARGYNGLGLAYQHMSQYDKAIVSFDKAIALDPAYIDSYNSRGLFFEKMGQFDKAIEDYNKAIALDPSYPESYFNRGIAFEKKGEFDKAIEDNDRAIALEPAYYAAYINRGVLEGQIGLFDKAIEDFNQSIVINPKPADAYSNRGIVYALTGQYGRALDDFNKALELNQNLPQAYFNRGKLFYKTGQKELAHADFQKACDLGSKEGCSALH
jgi:tetratricopeptide (TPR) repeat protein